MKKITTKKVLNYAAFSAAILGTADAAGQIVYTDIDDVTIDTGATFQGIDFNADSTTDVAVGLLAFTGGPGAVANGADENNSFNGNGIVGVAAGGFYYPSNLTSGAVIDSASPIITSERGDMYVYACYSNSQWCGEVTDGYVGASFDVGGSTHYGWVRLDVLSNGSGGVGSMVIKDFAYESTPGAAISAGDMGNVAGIDDQVFNGFSQFVDSNKNLVLSATTPMSNVAVYDVLGKAVVSNSLSTSDATVNLGSLNTGIYIARVTIEGQVKSFKIAVK